VVRPAAAADLEDAFLWYEGQRAGLGDAFLVAVDATFEKIRANPALHPVIRRETRRVLLRRFPYCVFFRAYPDVIVIVACMHARRDPTRWHVRE
jgi:plasmid stabilization system protein ParE